MFLLNKMVARSECNKVCIVCWRWDGHTARTADVRVTQLVRQHLNLIGVEVVVVPENMIV